MLNGQCSDLHRQLGNHNVCVLPSADAPCCLAVGKMPVNCKLHATQGKGSKLCVDTLCLMVHMSLTSMTAWTEDDAMAAGQSQAAGEQDSNCLLLNPETIS